MLDHRGKVKFALFCAKQVLGLTKDKRVYDAVAVVERWLEGRAKADECRAAAYAAYAAAAAADAAANAAYAAAYAANAAYAADAAAYAADAAAYAAAAADYAADYAAYDKENTKDKQTAYLKELTIDALPEDLKGCWLVVASL